MFTILCWLCLTLYIYITRVHSSVRTPLLLLYGVVIFMLMYRYFSYIIWSLCQPFGRHLGFLRTIWFNVRVGEHCDLLVKVYVPLKLNKISPFILTVNKPYNEPERHVMIGNNVSVVFDLYNIKSEIIKIIFGTFFTFADLRIAIGNFILFFFCQFLLRIISRVILLSKVCKEEKHGRQFGFLSRAPRTLVTSLCTSATVFIVEC